MARGTDEFVSAWRSLGGQLRGEGWRSIPVAVAGRWEVHAARRAPTDEEAIVVMFPGASPPLRSALPEGHGFIVEVAKADALSGVWLALARKESAARDLFEAMLSDLCSWLEGETEVDGSRAMRGFLARVRAWQDFMQRGGQPLSPEREIGLFGELTLLRALIGAGLTAAQATESWVGPLDAEQDFHIGSGAIEVKSTAAAVGFPIKVGSLSQLDDSVRSPLFVCGVRLRVAPGGTTLPSLISELCRLIIEEQGPSRELLDRLLSAGYVTQHAPRYERRFELVEVAFVTVGADFPRLTPGSVPTGILDARYEMDLDRCPGVRVSDVLDVLKKLGAA